MKDFFVAVSAICVMVFSITYASYILMDKQTQDRITLMKAQQECKK